MLLGRVQEQGLPRRLVHGGIVHARHPPIGLCTDDADGLGAALEEPSGRRGLVRGSATGLGPGGEETAVGELDGHLGPRVGGDAEALDGGLAVGGAVESEGLAVNEGECGLVGGGDGRLGGRRDVPVEWRG